MSLTPYLDQAAEYGLLFRGGFVPNTEDGVVDIKTDDNASQTAGALLLFGNAGSSIWPTFSNAPEYQDQQPDPLDRWSNRIGTQLAQRWGGTALFPFGGPPFTPFLQWAKKAEQLQSSKLGMLIHPEYGLWHAYRFAIALPKNALSEQALLSLSKPAIAAQTACDHCQTQSCLSSCPVDAFTAEGYDVKRCFDYLDSHRNAECHQQGCQARTACPEGADYLYTLEHAVFHMRQFYNALNTRFNTH